VLGIASLVACAALSSAARTAAGEAAWTEINWPLSFDPWGAGRAFRCTASGCGIAAELYVRPKLGFCNCTVGITGDEEVDSVGDMPAIGPDFSALDAGRLISVGTMRGRARHYDIKTDPNVTVHTLEVVTSRRCDVIVATLASRETITHAAERAAFDLLNSQPVLSWIEASTGVQQ
jgi:hypothetical protein